jgi:recombination protein RecT
MILADVVYEGDEFSVWTDENGRHLRHVPNLSAPGRGTQKSALYAYSIAKVSGEVDHEVMNKEEIEKVRSKSKSPNGTTWSEWWGEMAKKTVVRRFSKRLPTSAEAKEFFDREDKEHFDLSKNPAPASKNLSEKLAEDFGAFNEEPPKEETAAPADAKVVKSTVVKTKDIDPNSFDNFPGGPVVDPKLVK